MASYQYRCATCGPWEVRRPIGTAGGTDECPTCGGPGRREYTPPLLARTSPAMAAARLREETSRDEPAVTSGPPPRPPSRRPRDPRWSTLPRP
ncbi:zinc ribbon domain-containing protein [Geodermatophilus sp. YIM 151500]|uniref:zinc ribbon domain-containing protein n=1 Tax=Geodermatophilus sp. YIM 151500 TaxID=2984531 RepID=UPI0021E3AA78|nr:zinc ribbon domain-containing protein [Geodermatophilus sp. YIM 151500]MCV2487901.1 zinc ribbon domain-containing protein [Geodermatophilus sp. YIM 151500]